MLGQAAVDACSPRVSFSVSLKRVVCVLAHLPRRLWLQASDGTVLRAPTAQSGLAGMCRDTFNGHLELKIWTKSSARAPGEGSRGWSVWRRGSRDATSARQSDGGSGAS